MRVRVAQILMLCSLMLTFGLAQSPTSTSAGTVSLSVVVTTTGERAVTGLDIKHFRILEDQVQQTLVAVKENKLAGDYTLTYVPKNSAKDGSWRRVRVEIVFEAASSIVVRHAQGYWASPD